MIYFEKSQPAPICLAVEKNKKSGDYKFGDVLERLSNDFKNKCYICEQKAPTTINVEHFVAHQGNIDLKFDWNNLFWTCGHCNNTKSNLYNNLLNCIIKTDEVETALKYKLEVFPMEKVFIEILIPNEKATTTQRLLEATYNGNTELKMMESANLRALMLTEIMDFQKYLKRYLKAETEAKKIYCSKKIKNHLNASSAFTAFKRWIVRENPILLEHFKNHL